MKLWLIERADKGADFDQYEGAVVVAETADDARTIKPGPENRNSIRAWVDADLVAAKCLGQALPGVPRGVILAAYRAG